eukprot:TRINITY_DN15545_c0_g1_i1.p1 TRINITY_DN15545_c0_g1~~TRINITY_DN15545_c0_g1_i1.p1  ORF type:complete len:235 (-),score=35.95 TRINITY_DN15545_c0_g1_i1:242-886(-)
MEVDGCQTRQMKRAKTTDSLQSQPAQRRRSMPAGLCVVSQLVVSICDVQETFPVYSAPATPTDKSTVVASVARILTSWLKVAPSAPTTIFSGNASVTLEHFIGALVDLLKYLQCDETVLLTCITYLKRISTSNFAITSANIFRLLLASMLISVKFCDDVGITNTLYAQLVGLDVKDVINLERNFLTMMDFQFYISEPEFVAVCSDVRTAAAFSF